MLARETSLVNHFYNLVLSVCHFEFEILYGYLPASTCTCISHAYDDCLVSILLPGVFIHVLFIVATLFRFPYISIYIYT